MPLNSCLLPSISPWAMSSLVTVKDGTVGMKSYGSGARSATKYLLVFSGYLTQSYRCATAVCHRASGGRMRVAAPATVRKYPDCRIFARREPRGGRTAGDDCGAHGGTAAPAAGGTAEAAAPAPNTGAQPLGARGAPAPAGLRAAGGAALPRRQPRLGRAAPAGGMSRLRRQPARG